MKEDKSIHDRPEAYPKPTETDHQLNNQPEYTDQEPNSYNKEISDIPVQKEKNTDANRTRQA